MKKIISYILIVAMLFSLASCGEKNKEQVVKIGLLSIDDSLPFFMAEELGLYEKHNVKVELYTFQSAADKETALEAGEIDGDMTDLVVTALLKKGGCNVEIVSNALGANSSEGRFMILSAPNSNIKDPSDLTGIEIAVGDNTIVHYLSDTICKMSGIAKENIISTNIPSLPLRLEALLNGSVKAAVLPDPLASLAVIQGANCVYDDTKSKINLSQSIVLFTDEALKTKHSEIGRLMDAYFEAMEYINNNPKSQEVRNAILEFTSVPEVLFDTYETPSYSPKTLPEETVVDDTISWMIEKGLLDSAYTYTDLVIDDFVK